MLKAMSHVLEEVRFAYLSFLCTQPSTMWDQENQFWRLEMCKSRETGVRPLTAFEYRVLRPAFWVALVSLERMAPKHYSDWKVGLP